MSTDDRAHIAVVGAGALGTLFGAYLARAGSEVHLLHHDPAYAATLDGDVEVRERDGDDWTTRVTATADPEAVGVADVVIVLVRSYQTRDAVADYDVCLDSSTRVLTLQNGLTPYETLRDIVGEDRLLAGTTYQGAVLESPGVVFHTASGPTTFGGPDRAVAERVAGAFRTADIQPVTVVDDPLPVLWEKQLTSGAIKPLAALTGRSNGSLVADPEMRAVMRRTVDEIRAVAEAADVTLPEGDTVAELRETLADSQHRSSMLQDVAAERRTEIDAVNGAVVDHATTLDVEVPYNRLLTSLVHGLERRYLDEG